MDKQYLKKEFDILESLTKKMDVPIFRRQDVRWLVKNLEKRNSSHENFNEAMRIVQNLNNIGKLTVPKS